jgi:hypothetical protein
MAIKIGITDVINDSQGLVNITSADSTTRSSLVTAGLVGTTDTQTLTNKTLTSPSLTGTPTAPTAALGTSSTQIATTAFVQALFTSAAKIDAAYPIGSIYINAEVSTNPATLLGFGTWVRFGEGRVLIGVDTTDPTFDDAQKTGGSKDAVVVSHTHTLTGTVDSGGAHVHLEGSHAEFGTNTSVVASGVRNAGIGSNPPPRRYVTDAAGDHTHTFSGSAGTEGVSGTNANLPPYITVYMWRRIASPNDPPGVPTPPGNIVVSTEDVLAANAGATPFAVGTYAILGRSAGIITEGTNYAGSGLHKFNFRGGSTFNNPSLTVQSFAGAGGTVLGTWKAFTNTGSTSLVHAGLFLRIS